MGLENVSLICSGPYLYIATTTFLSNIKNFDCNGLFGLNLLPVIVTSNSLVMSFKMLKLICISSEKGGHRAILLQVQAVEEEDGIQLVQVLSSSDLMIQILG